MTETATYYIEVLLNTTEDEEGRMAIFARFRDEPRYQEGDTLEQVWSGNVTVPLDDDVLEAVWAMFNRGSGTFVGDVQYPHRSLSVGDCVRVDETDLYTCETIGWKLVKAW